ncbi:MAG: PqqD family protein, partial [Muribaculaceae bacterium]|nr:PqqD family protein [Muribaculaceae bacterium]
IWESLPDDYFDVETIASLLVARYDVDRDTAYKDARELAVQWVQAGIISD